MRPRLLPKTALVLASLGAATLLATYAVARGSLPVLVMASVALAGPIIGLGHIDNRARELEATDG